MSSYEWEKNCAIVDRLTYFQYTVRFTSAIFGILAIKDLVYIQKNFYADRARARLPKYAAVFLLTNFVSYWFNVYPLTAEEKRQQWLKYRHVGKLVYGLTFLTLEEDQKLWAKMKEDKNIKEEAAKH